MAIARWNGSSWEVVNDGLSRTGGEVLTTISCKSGNNMWLFNNDSYLMGIHYDGTNLKVNGNSISISDTFSTPSATFSWSYDSTTQSLTLTSGTATSVALIEM